MTLKQIEYLIELSKTLNFNLAAENLFISQPTLSYQIKSIEEEVGFTIFNRTKKGVSLTPAGEQFLTSLRNIQKLYRNSLEQGQNFSSKYKEDLTIGIPSRSCLILLPKAIEIFSKEYPEVNVTPIFIPFHNTDLFLRRELDVIFLLEEDARKIPSINCIPLFESKIYLITKNEDPLSKKGLISPSDLLDKTIMVGGDSPEALRKVQQELIDKGVDYFNSMNHDMTLINVAANKGICLSPGFLNDQSGEFTWTPYNTEDTFHCNLYIHSDDKRRSLKRFLEILVELYQKTDYPL